MLKGALITGVVVVGAATTVAVLSGGDDPVTVVKVIDGDTIDARIDGADRRIRLLNVDTPEYGKQGAPDDCLAEEATAYLQSVLPVGQEITLEYDTERTDRYDRDLAGVFVDGTLINAEIAREGFGVAVQFGSNDRFLPPVSAAEDEARAAGRGVHSLEEECLVSAQAEAVAGQAAPLLAAGIVAMSQADLDLHEEKVLAALAQARKVRTLAGRPSEFASTAYEGYRTEKKELDRLIERLDDRVSTIEQRRADIERKAEEERQRVEAERVEAERRAAAEAAEAAEAERRGQRPRRRPRAGTSSSSGSGTAVRSVRGRWGWQVHRLPCLRRQLRPDQHRPQGAALRQDRLRHEGPDRLTREPFADFHSPIKA